MCIRDRSSPVWVRSYLTLPSTGTSPAAEFKELRSCPPREKEPVQPLELVCSGVFFLNLLDHLVTLLLHAAGSRLIRDTLAHFQISRGALAVACQFWYQFVIVLDTRVVIRFQIHFSADFSWIFGQFGVPFCVFYNVCMHACMYMYVP